MKTSCLPTACFLFSFPTFLHADQITVLGNAYDYAVLGSSTVTNTGPTVLFGNLGLSPGTSVTGFLPGVVSEGSIYSTDAQAIAAQASATAAFQYLLGRRVTQNLSGQDLGGLVLTPGVYRFDSSAQLTGTLTLNFQGLNNADIILQTGSTLITASGSNVVVENQGTDDNVYYEVGSSATLGTYSTFEGDIIANTSVTMDTGANISCGSVMALNGAVTLDSNNIQNCSLTGSDVTLSPPSMSPPIVPPVPEPSSVSLVVTGLVMGLGVFRKKL